MPTFYPLPYEITISNMYRKIQSGHQAGQPKGCIPPFIATALSMTQDKAVQKLHLCIQHAVAA